MLIIQTLKLEASTSWLKNSEQESFPLHGTRYVVLYSVAVCCRSIDFVAVILMQDRNYHRSATLESKMPAARVLEALGEIRVVRQVYVKRRDFTDWVWMNKEDTLLTTKNGAGASDEATENPSDHDYFVENAGVNEGVEEDDHNQRDGSPEIEAIVPRVKRQSEPNYELSGKMISLSLESLSSPIQYRIIC